ncbi:olfactory receptor 5AC1-like [Puma concolor]|uniref:Olfactory receptor 5AC1-like n=1 Tax=Puma concolor TaxID=9696 RepID=A0A6P6H1K6_PUMCO|nr:olfactory receptor 5AC1-like [Puma concolor]
MMETNKTQVTQFVLTGLTDRSGMQAPLFLVFLVIYLTTMVGNLGLTFLTWKDPHLHTPMYLFLASLALADACSSSSVTPKMLMNFLSNNHMISLAKCITQFYIFASSATTECFLLVVMAYDRYAAICNPLLYPVVMSNRLCTWLISVSYAIGFLHPVIHVGLLFRLTSFSTCSAHLLSVSLFYGTLFFMYVRPGSGPDQYQDKMYSLFYTVIIPLLNPFIYSLRNKEVLGALRKVIKK